MLRYSYASGAAGTIVGTPLIQNEIIRVAIVRDVREDKTELPFTIDAVGQLVPAAGLSSEYMGWMGMNWVVNGHSKAGSAIPVGEKNGLPESDGGNASDDNQLFSFNAGYSPESPLEGNGDVYAYLVVLDTRYSVSGQLCCSGDSTRVARYAVRKMEQAITNEPAIGSDYTFLIAASTASSFALLPGLEIADDGTITDSWMDAEQPASLVIDGEEVTDREVIEKYLSPTVASTEFMAGTDTAKSLKFKLSSTDMVCYTLYTATSLTGTWTTFDELRIQKGLDTENKKVYTRFRIDGNSDVPTELTIPVFSDDTTRFYRFEMDN